MSEVWKDIPGFEGCYQASTFGRIRSLGGSITMANRWGTETTINKKGRVLRPWISKSGYLYIGLGLKSKKEVHYFVAVTFLGPRLHLHQVNHKDGIKTNNDISNLEWCTRSANIKHAFATGLNHSGSKHGISKLDEQQVTEIKMLLEGKKRYSKPYYSDLAKDYGVDRKTIEAIAKNKTWRQI